MSNMSYCRFRNTLSDFRDCLEALEEIVTIEGHQLSEDERRAAEEMVQHMSEFEVYTAQLLDILSKKASEQ